MKYFLHENLLKKSEWEFAEICVFEQMTSWLSGEDPLVHKIYLSERAAGSWECRLLSSSLSILFSSATSSAFSGGYSLLNRHQYSLVYNLCSNLIHSQFVWSCHPDNYCSNVIRNLSYIIFVAPSSGFSDIYKFCCTNIRCCRCIIFITTSSRFSACNLCCTLIRFSGG